MTTRRAQPVTAVPDGDVPATKATKARTPKAPKEPKVATAKSVELDSEGNPIKRTRTVRGERNHLATEIDRILRASPGPVTVREIVASITYSDGSHPSSGAVAAAIKRWAEDGYITTTGKPLGFKSFVGKHKNGSLTAFLEKSRETRLAARREARTAQAA